MKINIIPIYAVGILFSISCAKDHTEAMHRVFNSANQCNYEVATNELQTIEEENIRYKENDMQYEKQKSALINQLQEDSQYFSQCKILAELTIDEISSKIDCFSDLTSSLFLNGCSQYEIEKLKALKSDLVARKEEEEKKETEKKQMEEKRYRESPKALFDEACNQKNWKIFCQSTINKQKEIGAVSGVVNQTKLYEAGICIVSAQDLMNEYNAEYKKKTGKDIDFSQCKRWPIK